MKGRNKQKKTVKANGAGSGPYDPMSVTWLEKYDKTVSKIWNKLPIYIGKIIATVATFLVGISINGDWMKLYVHVKKQLEDTASPVFNRSLICSSIIFQHFKLTDFITHFIPSYTISFAIYYGFGGFLHWYYYVRQRDKSEEWKCQPKKWLSPQLERHEIMLGTLSLSINLIIASLLVTYIANDGYNTVYYRVSDYGWLWFFLQYPVIYVMFDYPTYWAHRMYHLPWMYKHFHKIHHKYKQPTAFSTTALHPIETILIQMLFTIPLFTIPVHWVPYYMNLMYAYYHGIINHSGINFKAYWWQPWQPDAIFHDNHHQYYHVNFGSNMSIWDKLHGTYRLKDRIYREDTFYGKSVAEVTRAELEEDIKERKSENPLAYRHNKVEFELSEEDVKQIKYNKY